MKFIVVALIMANLCLVELTRNVPMKAQPREREKAPLHNSVYLRREPMPQKLPPNFLDMTCFVDAVNAAENEPREHLVRPIIAAPPEGVTKSSSHSKSKLEHVTKPKSSSTSPKPKHPFTIAKTTSHKPTAHHFSTSTVASKKHRMQRDVSWNWHHANFLDTSRQLRSKSSDSSRQLHPKSSVPKHHQPVPSIPIPAHVTMSNETEWLLSMLDSVDMGTLIASNYVSTTEKVKNSLAHYEKECEGHAYKQGKSEGHKCLKSCVLMEFHLINYNKTSQHFRMRSDLAFEGMEDVDPNIFVKLLMHFGIDISSDNRILADLTRKVVHGCSQVLHEVANIKKLPCTEWEPFISCVQNAWKCPRFKRTYSARV